MSLARRSFLSLAAGAAASGALNARGLSGLKIGVTDWNLRQTAKLEAVSLARRLGFEGVQVSLGRQVQDNKLPLDNPELITSYLKEAKAQGIALDGTCLDVLHTNYLKNDQLGQRWVVDGIRLTKALGTKVMLLPFFGKGALETQAEKDYVGDVLRELAPEAEKAGVILGLEDTISAEDNVRIVERSRSKAVLVYYDIGNSHVAGFPVAREIDWLGKKRICQMHFKDNPHYLGEGKIDMTEVLRAVSRIDYEGFANLETDAPSKSVEADMKRNLAFVRKVMAQI
ncbi:MAG TPA: sugar phosphate isomerase/epimerase family protein [Bryobacteraceae bacterium]|nr:sugar phosphate isomerase/epimerase family protein [Bryobacteraceae bacterium]